MILLIFLIWQPERISGGSYHHKSDIWSFGLVILECATGRFPYVPNEQEGWSSFYELLEAIVDQPPPAAPVDQFSPEFCSFISAWSAIEIHYHQLDIFVNQRVCVLTLTACFQCAERTTIKTVSAGASGQCDQLSGKWGFIFLI